MSPIYWIDGNAHHECDCSANTSTCPKGRTRICLTAGFNKCMVPAPNVLMVGFDDLTPNLSEAEKVWRCRACGVEQDSSGPISALPEGLRNEVIEECAKAIAKRTEQLCSDPEVCYTEPDTGATIINSRFSDHVEALDEAEAIVRALRSPLARKDK